MQKKSDSRIQLNLDEWYFLKISVIGVNVGVFIKSESFNWTTLFYVILNNLASANGS